MVAGISHWHFGRFDLYRVNPPLVRMVATIPVVLSSPETDWTEYSTDPGERSEFLCGKQFIEKNGARSLYYFTIARWACIPFSLLGAWMCYVWANSLYGRRPGQLACLLWCFSPTIIGQAQMITPDVAATSFGLLAAFLFRNWLRLQTLRSAAIAGVGFGLALLTKTFWIILFVTWPLLWIAWNVMRTIYIRSSEDRKQARSFFWSASHFSQPRPSTKPTALVLFAHWLLIFSLALFTLNLGYGFERPLESLGTIPLVSKSLLAGKQVGAADSASALRGLLYRCPAPFPANFISGIDIQKRDFENGYRSYLRGEWKHGGWWYYYIYSVLIKEPLSLWVLSALLVITGMWRAALAFGSHSDCDAKLPKSRSPQSGSNEVAMGAPVLARLGSEMLLYFPAMCIVVLVSSQTGFNHHSRYVLPCIPVLYIWVSQIAGATADRSSAPSVLAKAITPVTLALVAWFCTCSIRSAPHHLSYFNESVGGPLGGRLHLVDSNIDWGQDLPALKRWYESNPSARPLYLAYFGMMDPRVLGIDYALPPIYGKGEGRLRKWGSDPPRPGWVAVSVSTLQGHQFALPDGTGNQRYIKSDGFTYLQMCKPVATAGYSIYIYNLSEEDIANMQCSFDLGR